MPGDFADFDLTDDELRSTGVLKWSGVPSDVLAAWVAEMDVRPAGAVTSAIQVAVDQGLLGYPTYDHLTGMQEATSDFMSRRYGHYIDPSFVILTGDVVSGIGIALRALCEHGAVLVPTPTYPPFMDIAAMVGRPIIQVPCVLRDGLHRFNYPEMERLLSGGARAILLANPANPLGRSWTKEELESLRDLAVKYDAMVISDEIHAPLVMDGVHVPFGSLGGVAGVVATVTSASKAWNFPGLKCAQVIVSSSTDRDVLTRLPLVYNYGVSSLGIAASRAAYLSDFEWLDGVVDHLRAGRTRFETLMSAQLPGVRWSRMEATYLAWLDLGGLFESGSLAMGSDPTQLALAKSRVAISSGLTYSSDVRHVRVNIGTSLERIERIVAGLANAWGGLAA